MPCVEVTHPHGQLPIRQQHHETPPHPFFLKHVEREHHLSNTQGYNEDQHHLLSVALRQWLQMCKILNLKCSTSVIDGPDYEVTEVQPPCLYLKSYL